MSWWTNANRVVAPVVDQQVGAEELGCVETGVSQVDGDDVARRVQLSSEYGGQSDRTGSDHGHRVAGLHVPVQDPDLERGGKDVGQHQDLLVACPLRQFVRRGVGEGHPDELGLRPIDEVTQDPATTAEALAVAAFPAESAPSTGADARHEDPISGHHGRDGCTDRLDGTDRFVTEDASFSDFGHIALQNVEV